eukprot:1020524-Prymnesium_polylepis.2
MDDVRLREEFEGSLRAYRERGQRCCRVAVSAAFSSAEALLRATQCARSGASSTLLTEPATSISSRTATSMVPPSRACAAIRWAAR